MWLIDASQINVGGAIAILQMVMEELKRQQIPCVTILDKRLKQSLPNLDGKVIRPDYPILNRSKIYRSILKDHSVERVVSLISIPPPIRVDVPTHTYFHNVNLLKSANINTASRKYRLGQRLKNRYINSKLGNTDYYAFQSELIQANFLQDFNFDQSQCGIFPFYKEEEILNVKDEGITKVKDSFIYISVDYPHKNHKRLFQAWEVLMKKGHTPQLEVTIPIGNTELCNQINELNQQGCQIRNLGVADFQTCLRQTAKAEYCIFPSLSESLGLGLVESQILGCKILASNLPYVHQAIVPSGTFDPTGIDSIVSSVITSLDKETQCSKLIMKNSLVKWIDFIDSKHP